MKTTLTVTAKQQVTDMVSTYINQSPNSGITVESAIDSLENNTRIRIVDDINDDFEVGNSGEEDGKSNLLMFSNYIAKKGEISSMNIFAYPDGKVQINVTYKN